MAIGKISIDTTHRAVPRRYLSFLLPLREENRLFPQKNIILAKIVFLAAKLFFSADGKKSVIIIFKHVIVNVVVNILGLCQYVNVVANITLHCQFS